MVVAEPSLILHPTLAIESMGNFHHHLMRNSHENQDPSTSVKKHPSAEIGGGVRFSHLTPHINISRPVKFNIPTSQLWQEVKNYRVEIEIGRRQTLIWMHFLVCPCPHWVEANFAREIKRDRGRSASKTIKPECHGRFVKAQADTIWSGEYWTGAGPIWTNNVSVTVLASYQGWPGDVRFLAWLAFCEAFSSVTIIDDSLRPLIANDSHIPWLVANDSIQEVGLAVD